jgi:RsiW-degrading membrane proteinase PrsW (M82 family)
VAVAADSASVRLDGVIFGAAAGMGFAAIEIGLYALARVETVGVLLGVLWFRALLSPFTHATWTAIVCATIWRARCRLASRRLEDRRRGRLARPSVTGAASRCRGLLDG